MTDTGSADGTLSQAIVQITEQVAQVPDHERIGFLKGAALNYPNLSQPDRTALFNLLCQAGTGVQPAKPGPISLTQNVNQNANPQINQTAAPQISQSVNMQSKPEEATGRRAWGLELLAAAAVLGAAAIAARCSKKPEETVRNVDSVETRSTKPATKPAVVRVVHTRPVTK